MTKRTKAHDWVEGLGAGLCWCGRCGAVCITDDEDTTEQFTVPGRFSQAEEPPCISLSQRDAERYALACDERDAYREAERRARADADAAMAKYTALARGAGEASALLGEMLRQRQEEVRQITAENDRLKKTLSEVSPELLAATDMAERARKLEQELAEARSEFVAVKAANVELRDDNVQLARRWRDFIPSFRRFVHAAGVYQRAVIDGTMRPELAAAFETAKIHAMATIDNPGTNHIFVDLVAFFDSKAQWSSATFGPGDRYEGVLKHIEKELAEIRANPSDLVEWIDVVLLAMDGAWRSANATGSSFVAAILAKDAENRKRKWPDWRTLGDGEVSEHIKGASE